MLAEIANLAPPQPVTNGPAAEEPAAAKPGAVWSVVGAWTCEHPSWKGTLTICPDGTFHTAKNDAGRWTLTGLQEHVALVLAWDRWGTEVVKMVSADEFRGKVRGGGDAYGEMTLHRMAVPALPTVPPVEFRTWHHGEPPVRLIRQDEGFCALTLVTGHFQGGGEVVKVYIGEDGYWYLGGQSGQEGVAAKCVIVRYPAHG